MAPLLGRISVMEAARLMSNSTYNSDDHASQMEQHVGMVQNRDNVRIPKCRCKSCSDYAGLQKCRP